MLDDLLEQLGDGAIALRLHVQPAAGRTAVVGRHGDALKVRVAAPPEAGRANEACAALLAETFGVRTDEIELTGGQTSRIKRFRLSGVELDDARRRLARAVESEGGRPVRPGER